MPPFLRHVDLSAVVAPPSSGGPSARFARSTRPTRAFENHRSLRTDLLGDGESGFPADLTADGRTRVRVLLDGTAGRAGGAAGSRRPRCSSTGWTPTPPSCITVLNGDLPDAEIERVMTLLRRDAATQRWPSPSGTGCCPEWSCRAISAVLVGASNLPRAQLLFLGQTVAADQLKVVGAPRPDRADRRLDRASSRAAAAFTMAVVIEAQVRELRTQRRGIVAEMESGSGRPVRRPAGTSLERGRSRRSGCRARAADRAGEGPDGHRPRRGRRAGGGSGSPVRDAAALRAVATDDPVGRAAAHLHQLRESGKLDAAAITEALRGLREQADVHARQAMPLEGPRMQAEAAQSPRRRLHRASCRPAYDAARPGGARTFDQVAGASGTITDVVLNQALRASGRPYSTRFRNCASLWPATARIWRRSSRCCRTSRLPRSRRSSSSSPSWRPSCSVALRRRPARTTTSRRPWPS